MRRNKIVAIRSLAVDDKNCEELKNMVDWVDKQSPRVVFLKQIRYFKRIDLLVSFLFPSEKHLAIKKHSRRMFQKKAIVTIIYILLKQCGNDNDRFRSFPHFFKWYPSLRFILVKQVFLFSNSCKPFQ